MLRAAQQAFSLVEVTVAIGIMAFAFLAIFGLIPVGLATFRKAVDVGVGAQIAERIFSECKGMTFDKLTNSTRWQPAASGQSFRMQTEDGRSVRYFNEAGEETNAADANTIYHVNVRVLPSTPFQTTGGPEVDNGDLATVTIQVANNPGNQPLAMDASTNLWTGALQKNPSAKGAVPLLTYGSFVGRNL